MLKTYFTKVADKVCYYIGSMQAFAIALLLVISWVIAGPVFNFSNTWQLIANTFTTIITFLIGFLLAYNQNRHARAEALKLDELIRVIREANNELIGLESEPDDKIDRLEKRIKSEA